MTSSRVDVGGDVLGPLEAAHSARAAGADWMMAVTESLRPYLDSGLGIFGWCYDASHLPNITFEHQVSRNVPIGTVAALFATLQHPATTPEMVESHWLMVAGSVMQDLGTRAQKFPPWRELLLPMGIRDVLSINARDVDGRGCAVNAFQPRRTLVNPRRLGHLERYAAHLISAYRLRRLGRIEDAGEAVLHPTGRILHADGSAKSSVSREALSQATQAIDRARGVQRRKNPDAALAAWRPLISGRWTLVEKIDGDGKRLLHAHPNAPTVLTGSARLSVREAQIVGLALRGHANKLIAYEMGLSIASVGTHLSRAMSKLRMRSRVELIASAGRRPRASQERLMLLTAAEREVCKAAGRGLSNAEISKIRGCTQRTVANQLSAAFRKLDLRSRSELAAALHTGG
jgi:DNA-binding CsgD family transcriptional regulator